MVNSMDYLPTLDEQALKEITSLFNIDESESPSIPISNFEIWSASTLEKQRKEILEEMVSKK